jgi:serine/arginine repetitive matrix protein 1
MLKVNLDVIKPWITKRLEELLGLEDDVVIEFVFNQLDEKVRRDLYLLKNII